MYAIILNLCAKHKVEKDFSFGLMKDSSTHDSLQILQY